MERTGASRLREWAFLTLLCILGATPFLFATIPPLVDLPGHLGRYFIEMDGGRSTLLARNWSFRWGVTPNLGFDLLVPALAQILGLEGAARLLSALLPGLVISGLARIGLALDGKIPPLMPLAALLAVGMPLQFGFVNYCLAWGLSLHVFASWVAVRNRGGGGLIFTCTFAVAAVVVWICHIYGWAILMVLCFSYEAWRLRNELVATPLQDGSRLAVRLCALGAPLALMAVFHASGGNAVTLGFFDFADKAVSLLTSPGMPVIWIDLILVGLALYPLLLFPKFEFSPPLVVALGLFGLCELALPRRLMGSEFADARLWPVMLTLLAVAARPRPSVDPTRTTVAPIVLASVMAFVAQTVLLSVVFARADARFKEDLRALDRVPPGAAIAVLTPFGCGGEFPVGIASRLSHLGDLAISRRLAFVNSQWSISGAQFLRPLRAVGTDFAADPSQFVDMKYGCGDGYEKAFIEAVQSIPPGTFDHVWMIDTDASRLRDFGRAAPLFQNDRSLLLSFDAARLVRTTAALPVANTAGPSR